MLVGLLTTVLLVGAVLFAVDHRSTFEGSAPSQTPETLDELSPEVPL